MGKVEIPRPNQRVTIKNPSRIPKLGARKNEELKLKAIAPEIVAKAKAAAAAEAAAIARGEVKFYGDWASYKKYVEAPILGTALAAKPSLFKKALSCILKPVYIPERSATLVGQGSFGSVDKVCMYEELGQYVAVKTMFISGVYSKLNAAINEIHVLQTLSGKNIFPQFFAAKIGSPGLTQKAYIIMGYCSDTLETLSDAEKLAVFPVVIAKVKLLHSLGYVHFDLKTTNICRDGTLLDAGSTYRIGSIFDFFNTGQTRGYSIALNGQAHGDVLLATQLYPTLPKNESGEILVDPLFDIYSLFQIYVAAQAGAGQAVMDWASFRTRFDSISAAPKVAEGGYRQTRRRKAKKPRQKKVTRRYRRPA